MSSIVFSDHHSQSEHSSNFSTQPDNGAPEELVRKENAAVAVVRLVSIMLFLSAAVGTSLFIFFFTRNTEVRAYDTAFESVSTSIVKSFFTDTYAKAGVAGTIATSLAIALQDHDATNLTIDRELFNLLTLDAARYATSVSWSPMLRTDEEREVFEAYSEEITFTKGPYPQCFLCDSKDQRYANPDLLVPFPGMDSATCSLLQSAALTGNMFPGHCSILPGLLGACICEDIPEGVPMVSNIVSKPAYIYGSDGEVVPPESGPYHPIWQTASTRDPNQPIMFDQRSDPKRATALSNMYEYGSIVFGETTLLDGGVFEHGKGEPGFTLHFPVQDTNQTMLGSVAMEILWSRYFVQLFPRDSDLVDIVIQSTCSGNMTYHVDIDTNYLQLVDDPTYTLHHTKKQSSNLGEFASVLGLVSLAATAAPALDSCGYVIHVHSSSRFEKKYLSNGPHIYALISVVIFAFTSFTFALYDFIVRRREKMIMDSATKTNNIVSSLFPQNIRDRLFEQADETTEDGFQPSKLQMSSFLESGDKEALMASEPIADLFPSATVMFLDIANFTSWCSERSPAQVFRLLETLYQSFDDAAATMGVFKVETIGDSYIAVCGLPKRRQNHAVVMAKFAQACLERMIRITQALERYLGPSTGDLRARVGLHSGPVTAGVLRGAKARFQLFGDTVNTAARMESSGFVHQIHASQATADLLIKAQKQNWITAREGKISIKGKGELQTCIVLPKCGDHVDPNSSMSVECFESLGIDRVTKNDSMTDRNNRLVEWNVEVLFSLIQELVKNRLLTRTADLTATAAETIEMLERQYTHKSQLVVDELTQILEMPRFEETHRCKERLSNEKDQSSLPSISPQVRDQLRSFVLEISSMHRMDVPFHNFEHASHVIMSASKLMKRIIQPDNVNYQRTSFEVAEEAFDLTYGISGDPMMHFAVVFSALIHDVGHTGLTNGELIDDGQDLAKTYCDRSVAEQHSVDIAWGVLMNEEYKDLRACLYETEAELKRFRQLIVNAVIATDIADKDLKSLREARWDAAFKGEQRNTSIANVSMIDRKATIVFEYIIQAADISHCMQHWHVYQKFNARLFEERYLAWMNGHCAKNPADGWYGGELWFFDNYIIPLAQKLDTCGVFGVSYHESLSYALENRKEWEMKGKSIVPQLLQSCLERHGAPSERIVHA